MSTATEPSAVAHANAASAFVRGLTHATLGPDAFERPSDAGAVLGALAELCGRLPQALDQTAAYLSRQGAFGLLATDDGTDPVWAAEQVRDHLAEAHVLLGHVVDALGAAHQVAATIAAVDVTYPGPAGRG